MYFSSSPGPSSLPLPFPFPLPLLLPRLLPVLICWSCLFLFPVLILFAFLLTHFNPSPYLSYLSPKLSVQSLPLLFLFPTLSCRHVVHQVGKAASRELSNSRSGGIHHSNMEDLLRFHILAKSILSNCRAECCQRDSGGLFASPSHTRCETNDVLVRSHPRCRSE